MHHLQEIPFTGYLFLLMLLIMGCDTTRSSSKNGSQQNRTLTMNHYMVPCEGEGPQWCYRVKFEGDENWRLLYERIRGLDYKWGVIQNMEVTRVNRENPMMDEGAFYYQLNKVLSTETVSDSVTFMLPVKQGFIQATQTGENTYKLLGMDLIQCASPAICKELETKLKEEPTVIGIFKHLSADPRIQLVDFKTL